jgi:hypothetical protein
MSPNSEPTIIQEVLGVNNVGRSQPSDASWPAAASERAAL